MSDDERWQTIGGSLLALQCAVSVLADRLIAAGSLDRGEVIDHLTRVIDELEASPENPIQSKTAADQLRIMLGQLSLPTPGARWRPTIVAGTDHSEDEE